MKYIMQQHDHDCSPTAIFNALRYYNSKIKFSKLSKLRRRCRVGKIVQGTTYADLIREIEKHFNIEAIGINKDLFLKHLESRPAILQFGKLINGHQHLIFVEKYLQKQKKIIVINCWNNGVKHRTHINYFKNISHYILLDGIKK